LYLSIRITVAMAIEESTKTSKMLLNPESKYSKIHTILSIEYLFKKLYKYYFFLEVPLNS
jgi:hypothetical protein